MKFLSIYIGTHDSNVSMAIDRQVRFAKFERISGIKRGCAPFPKFVNEMCEAWGNKEYDALVFVDCNWDNTPTRSIGIHECFKELSHYHEIGVKFERSFLIDHHYAHVLSAFPIIQTSSVDCGIAIDGCGSNFKIKQIVKGIETKTPEIVHFDQRTYFPGFLQSLGRMVNLTGIKHDRAGKLMGLQSYGEVDQDYVNSLEFEKIHNHIGQYLLAQPWRGIIPKKEERFYLVENPSFRDWLGSVHHALNMENLERFKEHFQPTDTIVYAGGGVQNTVFNQTLFEHFPNLHFVPHGYDGGVSLGGLEFLRIYFDQPEFDVTGFPYWQYDVMDDIPSDETIGKVAELLRRGKIVGWYQGRGEVGPRALGHRSILMDPRIPDAKETLNTNVKYREWYRPYAASILESAVGEYFEDERPSPYMMRCVPAKEGVEKIVPAVIHVDGTCRLQTVSDESEDCFASLLKEWYRRTDIPMLLNTSLNFRGNPIFGSSEKAFELFETEGLDAICVGKELLVK